MQGSRDIFIIRRTGFRDILRDTICYANGIPFQNYYVEGHIHKTCLSRCWIA